MNTLCILYTPSGCIHPIVEIDEIRDFNKTFLFSTKLNDIEVIMGTEDKFLKNAEQLVSNHPEIDFISIIGTPVTSITGVDLTSLGKKLESLTKKQVLVIETTGFENYVVGIELTLKKLADQMIESMEDVEYGYDKNQCINIIGYSPLSLGHKCHMDEYNQILENCGFDIHYYPSLNNGSKSKDIFSRTAVNIVVSVEGIDVAKDIFDVYGIPFIINIPVGIFGVANLLFDLKNYLTCPVDVNNYYSDVFMATSKDCYKRVLIIGDTLLSIAIGQCIRHDFGMNNIKVISIVNDKKKSCYMHSEELNLDFIEDEKEIIERIRESDIIIADPIFENLIKKEEHNPVFIPMPYPGLSGREFSNNTYEYIGKKGFDYFNQFLNTI
jgi:nitrogenase molybdenum-iron protein alpha/beta subunit